MTDDNKTVLIVCNCVALIVAIVAIVIFTVNKNNNQAITDMVAHGASPVAAACAIHLNTVGTSANLCVASNAFRSNQ